MSERSPVLSIVAICYNHERFVIEALNSILQIESLCCELIFCDDCSTDSSVQIANKWLDTHFPSAIRVINEKNIGICATLNKALLKAAGKYIKILACDDTFIGREIPNQIEQLERLGSDVVMCCSNFDEIDEHSISIRTRIYPDNYKLPTDLFQAIIKKPMVFSPQTAIWKKSVYDEIGGFDESYSAEGFQTWLKIFYAKNRAIYLPQVTAQYRILGNSFSHSGDWDAKFAEQRIRTLNSYNCEGERGEAIRKRKQKEFLTLLDHAYRSGNLSKARAYFNQCLNHCSKTETIDIERKVLRKHWKTPFPLFSIAQHDADYVRSLIDKRKISTGNKLIDYAYMLRLHPVIGVVGKAYQIASKLAYLLS